MGKVRDAMARDLQLRELATSTVDAYLRGARGLVAFYRRPPSALTREEILDYAAHMRDRGLSPSSRRVYLAAIRFMYRVTLRQPEKVESLPVPKVAKRKLRVLKGSEILRLRGAIADRKHRAIFCVLYGCGLRVSEVCRLRIEDVDSARGRILVRDGKGAKDRYVPLSAALLRELREYYAERRPSAPYLFPGMKPKCPIVPRSVNRYLREVSERLGFEPHVTPHQLRHAYATHQLELGIELRVVQLLLGHADPRSTVHYVTLTEKVLRRCPSPLDQLGTAMARRLA